MTFAADRARRLDIVRGAWQIGGTNGIDRIELSASFADWAHLSGSIRAVHSPYSVATAFACELVPGLWPEVAGSRGG